MMQAEGTDTVTQTPPDPFQSFRRVMDQYINQALIARTEFLDQFSSNPLAALSRANNLYAETAREAIARELLQALDLSLEAGRSVSEIQASLKAYASNEAARRAQDTYHSTSHLGNMMNDQLRAAWSTIAERLNAWNIPESQ